LLASHVVLYVNISDPPAPVILGHGSMYIHSNILVLHHGTNYKTGAPSEPVNELDHAMLSELSPLPRVRDALQKLLCLHGRNRWSFNRLLLALQNNDGGLANVQPQLICPIGMNQIKEIVHRIHALEAATDDQSSATRDQKP